jgi:hypothetical protein
MPRSKNYKKTADVVHLLRNNNVEYRRLDDAVFIEASPLEKICFAYQGVLNEFVILIIQDKQYYYAPNVMKTLKNTEYKLSTFGIQLRDALRKMTNDYDSEDESDDEVISPKKRTYVSSEDDEDI